jgi:hypothetical protein
VAIQAAAIRQTQSLCKYLRNDRTPNHNASVYLSQAKTGVETHGTANRGVHMDGRASFMGRGETTLACDPSTQTALTFTVKTRLCENLAQHTRGCNDIGTADLQQLIWRGCPDRHNRINICFTARHKFTEAPLAWRNLAKKTAYSDPAEVRSILSGSWTTGRRRTARLTLVSRSGAQVLAALLSLVFYDSLLQRHKLAYVRLFMRRQVRNTVSPQIGKQCPRFGPAHGKARAWRGS